MASKKARYVFKKTEPIANSYTLGRQIGQPGQFGVAKLCQRKKDKKNFAVKIIDKTKFHHAKDIDAAYKDMRNEIEALKALKHPNIIQLTDIFETDDDLYLVQELCTGGELFDRITAKEAGRYSEADAAGVIKQILEGIEHMHSKQIVHADLKPDNFLFATPAENAQLKIIDFGMAKKLPTKMFLDNMCGTPYYTAPEVLKGTYHRSADLWSVGVVMFVMLFGYPPFYVDPEKYGAKENEQIYKKIGKGFVPIVKNGFGRHFPATIKCSDEAKDLMKWLLRKDVAKRYTATQALDHKWFKSKNLNNNVISKQVASSITKFTKDNKFKLAMIWLFKDSMSANEADQLKKDFKKMDEDGDGKITLKEFQKFMQKEMKSKKTDEEIAAVFKRLDVDGDATLCFNELLQSVSDRQMREVPERMWKVFSKIDDDGDGYLTSKEIEAALEKSGDYKWFKKLGIDIAKAMKDADKNNDGKISYEEFVRAMDPTASGSGKIGDDDEKEDDEDDGAKSLVASVTTNAAGGGKK